MTMTHIPCEATGCRGQLISTNSVFDIESKIVGKVSVPNIEQYKCNQCDYVQISACSTDAILNYVRNKETKAISSLPVGEFVTPNQAIEILGCTKQAFSKNVRIKRGFIMFVAVDGKRLYHRKSVQLFKTENDGRFLIKSPSLEIQWVSPNPLINAYSENWVKQSRETKGTWDVIPAADNYGCRNKEQIYG